LSWFESMRGSHLIVNSLRNSGVQLVEAVIRLLSGFPILLAPLTAHVRTTPCISFTDLQYV
jgi:hypothetical protein